MRNRFAVVVLGLACMCVSGGLIAQDTWEYEFTPTLWVAGADGTASFDSENGPFTLEFDDLWRMEPGFAGTFQARKTRWGYLIDGAYARNAVGDQDWSLQFVTGGATFQLSESTALVFGARWASTRGGLRIVDPDEPDPDSDDDKYKKVSASDGWTDAILGLRFARPLGDRWGFEAQIDAGAGQSNLTYEAMAGFSYRFTPGIAAKAGYRLMGADQDDDNSDVDIDFGGLYAGVGFSF